MLQGLWARFINPGIQANVVEQRGRNGSGFQIGSCDNFLPGTHAHSHTRISAAHTSHAHVGFATIWIARVHFAKIRTRTGLLRIYELYIHTSSTFFHKKNSVKSNLALMGKRINHFIEFWFIVGSEGSEPNVTYYMHGNMKNETDTEAEKTIYYISRGFVILEIFQYRNTSLSSLNDST